MAKHRSQRALFEILAKEKAQRRAAEREAGPVIRRMGKPQESGAAERPSAPRRPGIEIPGFQRRGWLERRGVKYAWAALAAAGVVGLCVLLLLLGRWLWRSPALPSEPERPTMEEVREGLPEPGLVAPAPPPPAPAPAPSPAPSPAPAPAPAAAEGKYRLRIARLEVARSEYTDQLRALLAQRGVETDLEARAGYFVMYSQARFAAPDADDAKAFLEKVEAVQKEFERKTGWPATTHPYFVTVP